MRIHIFSFGFSRGPAEADYVFDLRFLPNPFWIPELRPHPGTRPEVAAYVLEQPETRAFLAVLEPLLVHLAAAWTANGRKPELRVALGCTGGFHRSVALTEHLARRLEALGYEVERGHRDLAGQMRGER